jgi:outer membrane protein assembly factor BamB
MLPYIFSLNRLVIPTFVSLVFLSACSTPDWLGGESAEKPLEGERITLFQTDTSISPDKAIEDQATHLPHPRRNTRWYKSTGQHILTEQNPRSPWNIKEIIRINTGKGSNQKSHPITLRPVIAEEKIFVMDAMGVVSAYPVEDTTKETIWETHIDVPEDKENFTKGGIAYDQGRLFISSGSTSFVALDASNGSLLWKKTLVGATRSAPDVRQGIVFVQTLDNKLYAFTAADGSILWIHEGIQKELTHAGSASPVALGDAVLASYASGELYALRSTDGKPAWSDNLGFSDINSLYLLSDIDSTPVVSEGHVYAASQGGVLAGFELFTGTRVWEREFPSSTDLWVAADFLYGMNEQAELASFYTVNGGVKWTRGLQRYENIKDRKGFIHWSGPVMAGSRLLVVSSHGKMLAVSPMTGEIIAEYTVAKNVYSAPVIAYGNIYLYDNNANLIIYSGPDKVATAEDFEKSTRKTSDKEDASETTDGVTPSSLDNISDFMGSILKRFKAEPEDDAKPDEKP